MVVSVNPGQAWQRHRNGLVEAIALLLGLLAGELLCADWNLPILAKAGAVVLLAMAPSEKPGAGPGGWRRWVARLPIYAGVSAAVAAIAFFWVSPPAAFYAFLPIWAALMAAWYFRGWFSSKALAAVRFAGSRRLDVAAGVALGAGIFWFLGSRFLPGQWPGFLRGQEFGRGQAVACIYLCATLSAYLAGMRLLGRRGIEPIAENIRWMVLASVWVLLLSPFMQVELHGASDAAWYGINMADMLAQVRHGVFPVFAGQSVYQFNGSVSPLRVAPAYQYLGALTDALTLRTLGVYAVQNLLLSMIGLSALATSYLSLAAVAPRHRWCACGLAILYVACPGVLGLAYNSDLYMSWTTVAVLPLVFYGLVRSFSHGDLESMLLVGGALGLAFWGHTPVAMWTTMFVGAAQLVRIALRRPDAAGWLRLGAGAGIFALIAAYPVVSVIGFPPSGGVKASGPFVAVPYNIVYVLREVFPAVLLPLSPNGRALSDFQLGYSLWVVFGFCLWGIRRGSATETRVLLAIAAAIVLLLAPLPRVSEILWSAEPSVVHDATGLWVMKRLYLVMACAVVFAGALACGRLAGKGSLAGRALGAVLVLLCAWSLLEAGKFAKGSEEVRRPRESAEQMLRTENVSLTRYSYLFFANLPETVSYFSHGVVDPLLENRLLSRSGFTIVETNVDSVARAAAAHAAAAHTVLTTEIGYDSSAPEGRRLRARDPIVLEPGKRYLVGVDFLRPEDEPGVLQFKGAGLVREYLLPKFGGSASFGRGGMHSKWVPLWTSGAAAEEISVHFFPTDAHSRQDGPLPFARLQVIEYDPAALPVRIDSWIPYRARVVSVQPGWLETPRMYQEWYRARVDGGPAEVRRSPEGLAMVAVPAGESHVDLEFAAPLLLKAAFWVSLGSAAAIAGWGIRRFSARTPASARA